ncbi:MAG: chemotaxis protein CheW, partial [Betaproteobacteria bacterium]|nr:chemotaxis protein CheW [Betaproteobacteria bacterium]
LESHFEDNSQDIGVIVDTVQEVLEIPSADIEPPPSFGTKIRPDFIQGMGKVDNRFVIILNLARILSVDDMSALAQASAQPTAST